MAAPFCTACGAAVADGTRFCVKCGQPVGQAAPLVVPQTQVYAPPPPPPSIPQVIPAKEGPGAGLWIGIFGILLLLGGAGLWFYTTRMAHPVQTVQVAATPPEPTVSQPTPVPTPEGSTLVPAPTPNPTTEVVPPNPDQAQKNSAPPPAAKQPSRPAVQMPAAPAEPPPPVKAVPQTSGVLHAAVEVAQNGEVVFENLPGGRLKFTFDHSAWQPTISRQANGTQTLVMRSLRPGIQTTCDVRWEVVQ